MSAARTKQHEEETQTGTKDGQKENKDARQK